MSVMPFYGRDFYKGMVSLLLGSESIAIQFSQLPSSSTSSITRKREKKIYLFALSTLALCYLTLWLFCLKPSRTPDFAFQAFIEFCAHVKKSTLDIQLSRDVLSNARCTIGEIRLSGALSNT